MDDREFARLRKRLAKTQKELAQLFVLPWSKAEFSERSI